MHDVALHAKEAHAARVIAGAVVEAIASFVPFEPDSIRNQLKRALKAGVSVAAAKSAAAADESAAAAAAAATQSASGAAAAVATTATSASTQGAGMTSSTAEMPRDEALLAAVDAVTPDTDGIDWTSGERAQHDARRASD